MIELPSGWYGTSRIFGSGQLARAAYLAVGEQDKDGRLGVGVCRHQRIGLDSEAVLVSVVGLQREGVEEAERLLGGEEVELHFSTWKALVDRRVQVLATLNAQGRPDGHYVIKQPKGGRRL